MILEQNRDNSTPTLFLTPGSKLIIPSYFSTVNHAEILQAQDNIGIYTTNVSILLVDEQGTGSNHVKLTQLHRGPENHLQTKQSTFFFASLD